MVVPFSSLQFGYATAEIEGATAPDLLTRGFVDHEGVIQEAVNGSRFLFLGYKGSGKSAIGEHLRLTAASDPELFATLTSLSDFPYKEFSDIPTGSDETRYPTAWSWLLLLHLFASFVKDEGVLNSADDEFFKAVDVLEKLGLLPLPELRRIVQSSTKLSGKLMLPLFAESSIELTRQDPILQIPFFTEKLKLISQKFSSRSRHLLVIDGLDDVLTKEKVQYEVLAGLLLEVSKLNLMFQKAATPAKVVILCRTDLYERLPWANKNKIRQDASISLDWYHDPKQPMESDLVRLVNLRASLTDPGVNNIFQSYLPRELSYKPACQFLLENTRHTPRDFVQVFKHIQAIAPGTIRLTPDQVKSGLRNYSIQYFLPEIKDELVGYVDTADVDRFMDILGSLHRRQFTLFELESAARSHARFSGLDLPLLVTVLFECSAIGNVNSRGTGAYYYFKYWNRHASINLEQPMILHRGMWKALNVA